MCSWGQPPTQKRLKFPTSRCKAALSGPDFLYRSIFMSPCWFYYNTCSAVYNTHSCQVLVLLVFYPTGISSYWLDVLPITFIDTYHHWLHPQLYVHEVHVGSGIIPRLHNNGCYQLLLATDIDPFHLLPSCTFYSRYLTCSTYMVTLL
jgi:hypothetical protein